MADLQAHWDYLKVAWATCCASPLSVRKALLVIALMDAFLDRIAEATAGSTDILEFRRQAGAGSPALACMMRLACHAADGPKLLVGEHAVPIEHYGALAVEDFMVSLYNGHTVQHLVILETDGAEVPALAEMNSAMSALDKLWADRLK